MGRMSRARGSCRAKGACTHCTVLAWERGPSSLDGGGAAAKAARASIRALGPAVDATCHRGADAGARNAHGPGCRARATPAGRATPPADSGDRVARTSDRLATICSGSGDFDSPSTAPAGRSGKPWCRQGPAARRRSPACRIPVGVTPVDRRRLGRGPLPARGRRNNRQHEDAPAGGRAFRALSQGRRTGRR
jgi:hypothetical protein